MILAEGFQYLQGLLTGDLNEADICHKYHQQRFLCRIRPLALSHSVPENWEGKGSLAVKKVQFF